MTDSLPDDWVALWQSELAAMAADRELRETWTGLLALWAVAASAAVTAGATTNAALKARFTPGRADDQTPGTPALPKNRTAGATQPEGAAPAAPASEPGDAAARRLHERIAKLESRLATLEGQRRRKPGDA